jgi:spore coat polysaccharide biosynthesis protein SpsF
MNGIIVQARVGSKRLKNKMLMPLAGKPMILRIIERLKRVKNSNKLIVAIPDTRENNSLVKILKNQKIIIFRGSENNLVERYYFAAKKNKIKNIIRFPGDNCLPEPSEIEKIINFYEKFKKPFFASNLSNILNNGYPDGIGAEIFDINFLEDLMNKKLSDSQKEHPHTNFFDYKTNMPIDNKWCKVRTIKCNKKFKRPEIKLDVNTMREYKYIKNIYDNLYFKDPKFNIIKTIKFLDEKIKK